MFNRYIWIFCLLFLLILTTQSSYSFNRFFDVKPGFRVVGMAVDIYSRVPNNSTTTRFDYGGGLTLDIQMEKIVGLGIEFLYLRKGSDVGQGGRTIYLNYFSVPTLAKFWLQRNKFAAVIGPVHNFLLAANGRLKDGTNLNAGNTNFYDLGICFGITYIMADFGGGVQLVGDFRFEFGLINVYSGHRPELYNRTAPHFAIGLNF